MDKEVMIKVKFDDYKMVSNYIKNELGINKTVINEMVDKSVEKSLSRNPIQEQIMKRVERFIGYRQHEWNFETKLQQMTEKTMQECVDKVVKEEAEAIIRLQVREKLSNLKLDN